MWRAPKARVHYTSTHSRLLAHVDCWTLPRFPLLIRPDLPEQDFWTTSRLDRGSSSERKFFPSDRSENPPLPGAVPDQIDVIPVTRSPPGEQGRNPLMR